VLQLANKEGGSHVDPRITEEFEEIKREAFGVEFFIGDEKLEKNDVVSATMRQIAHEVLVSLVDGYEPARRELNFEIITMGSSIQVGSGLKAPPRNDLCPCKSGLKFKKCHYR
jgi:hypothetical protein